MASKRSKVHPKFKTKYRVSNWRDYDASLVQRGSLSLWLSPEAIAGWDARPSGRRGAQRKYSDLFGDHMQSRNADSQAVEARLACNMLNRMTDLGRPKSYAIAS